MSSDPHRDKTSRQSALFPRLRAGIQKRLDYWQQSALVKRLQSADVINRGLLFAAVLLLCFVPFLLVVESLAGRNQAVGFIQRFGLTGEAAHAVRQAFTAPTSTSAAVSGLSWVFFVVGGIAGAAAIQELYERVFEVQGRGFRDTPQRIVWLIAAVGVTAVSGWIQPIANRAGGGALVAVIVVVGATIFWWFSMWLLLAGKQSWRHLFPSALATGICWLGMVIAFRLTLSTTIASDYRKYGSIGVVFAIMSLLIAVGVVIMLGALLGLIWQERYERHARDESIGPSSARDRQLTQASSN